MLLPPQNFCGRHVIISDCTKFEHIKDDLQWLIEICLEHACGRVVPAVGKIAEICKVLYPSWHGDFGFPIIVYD
jgi:hypothetical protein